MVSKRKSKDSIYIIPKVLFKRIVEEIISQVHDDSKKNKNSNKRLIGKKALEIIHYEAERYVKEIFAVSELMIGASKRHTLSLSYLTTAVEIHQALTRPNVSVGAQM